MFRLGRLRPALRPRLRLVEYLDHAALPLPPAMVDAARDAPALADVLGNDTLGDCTAAGAAHVLAALRFRAGAALPQPTAADAVAFYSRSTGYDPADPTTDRGGDEIAVLDCWKHQGFFADGSGRISGYAGVDATNIREIKQAIWLFGNLYLGLELPDAWITPFPSADGFIWYEAGRADARNGHCIVALGYDALGLVVSSWGLLGHLSWHALGAYARPAEGGEAYVVFSPDEIEAATQKAPNGFAALQLGADLLALG